MNNTSGRQLADITERATILPLKLQAENQRLKKELVKLYEREAQLLEYIDIQDRHGHGTAALKQLPAKFVLGTDPMTESDLETANAPRAIDPNMANLLKRYDALSKSRLGRLQLWYWRTRAGK
ncbi:hypothetical protein Q2T94_16960 [Paeniglutamicibacter sulfureus]|uniref:hypothetical protein n=1 Tax=Paeniglutamicibacter sulfureus TaxID=43666 RepID=UPI002664FDD9|nr:hypothetical protein [Paeniglutamicibacter sulfureus]MDO2935992.1 hypothetical protein [Paeniglutamicibacter sulfureus]